MSNITVIFQNLPPIHIELYNTTAARIWHELFVQNYQQEFPLFRDMQKYSRQYLEQLVTEANNLCDWNFTDKIQTIEDTVDLHKHIEVTLANGYQNIPANWDHLLDELHFALHKLQHGNMSDKPHRGNFLQIEWFNDNYVSLPEDFVFDKSTKFGSLRLQNAYVGHTPWYVYTQNDCASVAQTCRFHDRIKPGLHIVTSPTFSESTPLNVEIYAQWWYKNAPEFIKQHGLEKIMYYTGHPIIGQVFNTNDLELVVAHPKVLELQEVVF